MYWYNNVFLYLWGEARGRVEPAKKSHRIRTGCPSTLSHVKCFMPHPLFRVPTPVRRHSLFRFFRSHARFRYCSLLIAALPRSRTGWLRRGPLRSRLPYHEEHFSDSTMALSFFLSFFQINMHHTRALTFSRSHVRIIFFHTHARARIILSPLPCVSLSLSLSLSDTHTHTRARAYTRVHAHTHRGARTLTHPFFLVCHAHLHSTLSRLQSYTI